MPRTPSRNSAAGCGIPQATTADIHSLSSMTTRVMVRPVMRLRTSATSAKSSVWGGCQGWRHPFERTVFGQGGGRGFCQVLVGRPGHRAILRQRRACRSPAPRRCRSPRWRHRTNCEERCRGLLAALRCSSVAAWTFCGGEERGGRASLVASMAALLAVTAPPSRIAAETTRTHSAPSKAGLRLPGSVKSPTRTRTPRSARSAAFLTSRTLTAIVSAGTRSSSAEIPCGR